MAWSLITGGRETRAIPGNAAHNQNNWQQSKGRDTNNQIASSYDTPEIILTPIVAGERRYLSGSSIVLGLALLAVPCRADVFDNWWKQLGSTNETRAEAAERIAQMGGARAEQFREMIASTILSVDKWQLSVAAGQ